MLNCSDFVRFRLTSSFSDINLLNISFKERGLTADVIHQVCAYTAFWSRKSACILLAAYTQVAALYDENDN